MKNKINQDEIILKMLILLLEEQENEIIDLKNKISIFNSENKLLSKKREHLLKDKLALENKLIRYNKTLKKSIIDLRDIKFIKFPLKKYRAYKTMLNIFHKINK